MTRAGSIIAAAALVLVGVVQAQAALPPYWQSVREITAIIEDQRVHDALRHEEPILSITTTGDDVYLLRTERCTLSVSIIDKPQAEPMAGARQFDMEIGEAICVE